MNTLKKSKIEISVVIPVYNSEDCIDELLSQLDDALLKIPYEVVLVNDCSRDGSWKKIRQLSVKNKHLVGASLRKNAGQDNAIMAGLSLARGNYIVIMDDDLQHSPFDILALYAEIKKGSDVCYADFTGGKKQALWKNLGSWLNGKVAEIVLSKPPQIYLSPFKIIKKDIVDEIRCFNGSFPYVDGIIFKITQNISQISAQHYERFRGESNYSLFKSIIVFMKLLTGFSVTPLRISSYLGIIVAFIGFVGGIANIVLYFLKKGEIEGWTSLIVIILFLGGLILMSLGMIGEYVGRMYISMNNHPKFSIGESVNASGSINKRSVL